MADRARLVAFIGEALRAGKTRAEIRAALGRAGWAARDIDAGLAQWAEDDFVPPVPAPAPFASARDAFYYGLTFFALGAVLVNVISLAFTLIDGTLGGEILRRRDVAWQIAALVVFAPVFAFLDMRGRGERNNPVRKIFAYGALFFASLVLLLTLVTVIGLVLFGGIGGAVLAKAASVAIVAGLVWIYYRADLASDRT